MKVVLTLLVRDEEDIIAENIEYHLSRGVDFIVVTDNLSVDGTGDILEAYRRLGALHYIFEPEDNYAQSEWVTRMARLAIGEFGADWVINSDADEFWWPEHKEDLKEVLRDVPASVPGLCVRRHNFPPSRRTSEVGFLEAMTHREARPVNGLGELLPPKVCHRAIPGIIVSQGNHSIRIGSGELDVPETGELCIFHYPMRTLTQFRNKIEKGGAAYARSTLPVEIGSVWRELYRVSTTEGLKPFFEQHLYDDQKLSHALVDGRLIEDLRLSQFFRETGLSRKRPVSG